MPLTSVVTALPGAARSTAGQFLRTVADGAAEPPDLVIVAVPRDDATPDPDLADLLGAGPQEIAAGSADPGEPGRITTAVVRAGRVPVRIVCCGVGDRSPAALRRAGGELGRLLRPGQTAWSDVVSGLPAERARILAESILLGSYRYRETAADWAGSSAIARVGLAVAEADGAAAAIETARVIATAVALTRDLSNTPSVRKSPQWLADSAARVAAESGLDARIWTSQELAAAGFGGIRAVGAGSSRPPVLIELRYTPPGASRHVVLVGKGITFDSGGLSLKPTDGMTMMKTDMAGGAAVIGAMSALARLGVATAVTGLVPAAENMPSGSAYRPGDVITQFGGRTVEVLNTDAEGRLVLADALAYADRELAPDEVVDIATLTGAARVALGRSHAALYATSDDLAGRLLAAGEASGDRLWRMPLADDYRPLLDSQVADLAHVATDAEAPGSVTAALFLREFAGRRPWAHLDIAGAARRSADDGELTAGATGFGTRLLLHWLAADAVSRVA